MGAADSTERDHRVAGADRAESRKRCQRDPDVQSHSILTVTLFANPKRDLWEAWIGEIVGVGASREDALLDLRERMLDAVDLAVLYDTPTEPQPIELRRLPRRTSVWPTLPDGDSAGNV